MYDVVGIVIGFIFGSILLLAGNTVPDQTDIILQYNDEIMNLGSERWACGEDVQCQKVKTNSINAIKTSINTVEITQSFRNSLLMWGGIIDALMVILGFFTIKSR